MLLARVKLGAYLKFLCFEIAYFSYTNRCVQPKKTKTMKSKLVSTNKTTKRLVWTILTVCLLTISCKKEKSRICELYDSEVEYAIGTIQSISTSPFKATYKYDFTAQGENYNGKEKAYGIGQKDETLIGKQFIVIYALGDPSNSDLNTDFLIETEADFDNFSSDYSSGPTPPDFPNNCK